MANPDRLSGLDASFLSLERSGAHMHVGSVLVFEGEAPHYDEFVAQDRAAAAPRAALPPEARLPAARPGPPGLDRRPALQRPLPRAPHRAARARRARTSCAAWPGASSPRRLDRSKPLWEMWLVDRVGDDAFALISKTHHALVDGVSGVDILTVLFDLEPDPPEPDPAPPWYPRPEPSAGRAARRRRWRSAPRRRWTPRAARSAPRRHPERAVAGGGRAVTGLAAMAAAGLAGAPPSPLNVRIGSHRRFAWVDADLERFKAIKSALGGTVNDVVLAAVTGALRALLHPPRPRPGGHGAQGDGAGLRARRRRARRARQPGRRDVRAAAALRGGRRASASAIIHEAMGGLKESGQAVGAEVLTRLAGFAAPTVLDQAVAAADPPALLQPRRDERARPAVPALPAGPPAARLLPAGPADAQHRARDRDHVLRRPARLRAARRLRRDAGPRRRSPPTSSARSTSSRRPRGSQEQTGSKRRRAGRPPEGRHDLVRRLLALLLGTVLVAGGVFALLVAFNARDDAGVGGGGPAGPGQLQPDLGSRHLAAGQHVPLDGPHRSARPAAPTTTGCRRARAG